MKDGQRWAALVTFDRHDEEQDILPEWTHGACGWMMVLAPDEAMARDRAQQVFCNDDVEELDDHLASNFRSLEPGRQTIWGTIHCYKGEGET